MSSTTLTFQQPAAAELGRALTQLVRGALPPSPPGTWWFYGPPGGRRTIAMRRDDESQADG